MGGSMNNQRRDNWALNKDRLQWTGTWTTYSRRASVTSPMRACYTRAKRANWDDRSSRPCAQQTLRSDTNSLVLKSLFPVLAFVLTTEALAS
jgi:hypothetical protein